MTTQNFYRTPILPVSSVVPRPKWSVMIPTYNCAEYLRQTLQSVLSQDLGPALMQIEVVDDCSTRDDPATVVRELSGDRVHFFQQPHNRKSIANFNTCLNRSRGELVHLLHGDDFVKPRFYTKMQAVFDANPTIGAAFCRHNFVDENNQQIWLADLQQEQAGILENWLSRIAVRQKIQPPSMVVRREVYEAIGGFDSRICCCAEDWEMWVRIAAHYPVGYEPEVLASYRSQLNSLTGNCARSGQNIRDIVQVLEIISHYLPEHSKADLLKEASQTCAHYYVHNMLPELFQNRDAQAIFNQLRELPKLGYLYKTSKELAKMLVGQVQKNFLSHDKTSPGAVLVKPIPVVLAADNNYAMQVAVTACSVLANLDCDTSISFFIIDGGIRRKNQQKIIKSLRGKNCTVKFLTVADTPSLKRIKEVFAYSETDGATIHKGAISLATYYRLLLPELLANEIDKVIYLDCDLVVEQDLSKLWQLDLSNDFLAAVPDMWIPSVSAPNGLLNYQSLGISANSKYFNAGVLLINLRKWRDENILGQAMDYLKNQKEYIRFHDQDILNSLVASQWYELDPRWNLTPGIFEYTSWQESPFSETVYDELVNAPYIVHFAASVKPWNSRDAHFKRYFFKYIDLTAWSGWKFTWWTELKLKFIYKFKKLKSTILG